MEAMSLYNHVASKDEIVDGIVDLVASRDRPRPTGDDWKEAMRRRVISAHEVLLAASLGLQPLDVERRRLGEAAVRYADRCASGAFGGAASGRS